MMVSILDGFGMKGQIGSCLEMDSMGDDWIIVSGWQLGSSSEV